MGLSQYGARGRALAGQLAPEILAHYYASTTLATQSTATPIRVLLVSGFTPTSAIPARVIGRGGTWTVDGVERDVARRRLGDDVPGHDAPTAGWRLRIEDRDREAVLTLARSPSSVRIRPAASARVSRSGSSPAPTTGTGARSGSSARPAGG